MRQTFCCCEIVTKWNARGKSYQKGLVFFQFLTNLWIFADRRPGERRRKRKRRKQQEREKIEAQRLIEKQSRKFTLLIRKFLLVSSIQVIWSSVTFWKEWKKEEREEKEMEYSRAKTISTSSAVISRHSLLSKVFRVKNKCSTISKLQRNSEIISINAPFPFRLSRGVIEKIVRVVSTLLTYLQHHHNNWTQRRRRQDVW